MFPPAAAAAPAPATPSVQKAPPGWENTMAAKTEKHQNCAQKLPNVISETMLLATFSSAAAAAAAPAPATPSVQKARAAAAGAAAAAPAPATLSVQKAPPGWENTMAAKGEKTSKLRPNTP